MQTFRPYIGSLTVSPVRWIKFTLLRLDSFANSIKLSSIHKKYAYTYTRLTAYTYNNNQVGFRVPSNKGNLYELLLLSSKGKHIIICIRIRCIRITQLQFEYWFRYSIAGLFDVYSR